jgi:hypothetical protein
MSEPFDAQFANSVTIGNNAFTVNAGAEVVVPWESIQFVGAVHEIDAMALDDVFF